ncbi:MAG: S41 family peptidase [Candidatus Brocadiaceae bacterium]|nr:S41 family peptidase [Candidatus Brocadiaceae bacterium]
MRDVWIGVAAGLALGLLPAALPARSAEQPDLIEGFVEPVMWLVREIEGRSVDEISHEALLEGACAGMMSKLDRHSAFWPPAMRRETEADLKGEFGGLGIQITFDPPAGVIHVEQPIAGTPAARLGVLPHDRIIRVREESTRTVTEVADMKDVHEVLEILRGPPGTRITITILRGEEEEEEERDITVTREIIKIPGVRAVEIIDHEDRIGYIYIPYFSEAVSKDLAAALEDLQRQGMRGLILDLRFNPGGLLDAANALADRFLDGGAIVTVRAPRQNEVVHEARRSRSDLDLPLVLLVNRLSASGSEIVAGALQDHRRAVLVGETTYGKASVQQVMDNPHNQSAIKLTVARYYTPNDHMIEGRGVVPDIEMRLSDAENRKLYTFLTRKTEYPPHPPEESAAEEEDIPEGPDEPGKDFRDVQFERALEVLRQVMAGTRRPGDPPDAAPDG